ncbi:Protein of unknown function [Bacillus cereus]|nr:Protein of unknown function [Bacillus cereus]
MTGGQIG